MGFKETMMGFAGKVSDTVDKGIETGKESYQKMSEKNRLNKEIKTLTAEVNDILLNVGRQIYNTDPNNAQFSAVFSDVRAKEDKIASDKQQLSLLDGNIICPACGAVVPKDSRICNQCGATIVAPESPAPEVIQAESVNVCVKCGATLPDGAKFCGKCGNPVA